MSNPFARKKQCAGCPWKKSTDCEADIPKYDPEKHRRLATSCRASGALGLTPGAIMACHESKTGSEYACVGWLVNQLGPGNNIPLRIAGMDGKFSELRTDGDQHESLEEMCGVPTSRVRVR